MRRWYFWVLAPVMLVSAIGLPFLDNSPTWRGHALTYILSGALLLAGLGFASPRRFNWAFRAVAGLIFLTFLAYVIDEGFAWWRGKPFVLLEAGNLFHALCVFVVFGIPCLFFLLRGRSSADEINDFLGVEDKDDPS